jgi:hypothetical protein
MPSHGERVADDVRIALESAAGDDDARLRRALHRLERSQDSSGIVLALTAFAAKLRAARSSVYAACVEARVEELAPRDPVPQPTFAAFADALFLEVDAARLVAAFDALVALGDVALGRSLRAAILVAASVAVDVGVLEPPGSAT